MLNLALTVALFAGAAWNDSNAGAGPALDLYGFGGGARAGVTFPVPVYVGLSALVHRGFDRDLPDGAHASGRVAPLGVEAGYELALGALRVRPYLGAGVALYDSSLVGARGGDIYGHGKKLALWPGVIAATDLGDHFAAGLDVRWTMVSVGADDAIVAAGGGTADGLGAYATLAYRF